MFKYEMHIHSAACSRGGADIEDHIRTLVQKGYAGMVITNHFIHGDTPVDRSLSWEEFITHYREDYERGKRLADELDFDLLFGIEEMIGHGSEILVYGITPEFLVQNPVLREGKVHDYVRLVHEAGGLVFQAHPYRDRWYIEWPYPIQELDMLDGVEGYNASNTPEENQLGLKLAREKGMLCIAGSDGHSIETAGRSGIATSTRIRTGEELVKVLKSNDFEIIM